MNPIKVLRIWTWRWLGYPPGQYPATRDEVNEYLDTWWKRRRHEIDGAYRAALAEHAERANKSTAAAIDHLIQSMQEQKPDRTQIAASILAAVNLDTDRALRLADELIDLARKP